MADTYPPGSDTTHQKSASYPATFHILQEKCKEEEVQCLRKGIVYPADCLKQSILVDLLFSALTTPHNGGLSSLVSRVDTGNAAQIQES